MNGLTQTKRERERAKKNIFKVKYGFENENTGGCDENRCFLCLLSWRGGLGSKAAADRSHMLPRCSALQRCQASLKE